MKKKELKQRIKELEFENEMLRAMRPYPVYYQVYSGSTAHAAPDTWISGDTCEIGGDWQIVGSTTVCIDQPLDSATLAGELTSRGVI